MLDRKLVFRGNSRLLSLRAMHVPGTLNTGADLSRGVPTYRELVLYLEIVMQIWARYGQAVVDLLCLRENMQCTLFISLHSMDVLVNADYPFPPGSDTPTLARGREHGHHLFLVVLHWPANGASGPAASRGGVDVPRWGLGRSPLVVHATVNFYYSDRSSSSARSLSNYK